MTTNLDSSNNPSSVPARPANYGQAASVICLLAGIWFFFSPWIYSVAGTTNAWNSWIAGAAMFLIAAMRLGRPVYAAGISWLNMLLGAWVFFSPWIFGYTANEGRFINSLCVGAIVFLLSTVAVFSHRNTSVSAGHRA